MTALNKSGRKPSPNGQAKKHSVTVKAKIKRTDEMEYAVNERPKKKKVVDEAPAPKKKKKRVVPVEDRVVKTLKKQIADASEGRALVPVESDAEVPVLAVRKISKLRNTNKMRSILGDEAENIHQLVEVVDSENATSLIN